MECTEGSNPCGNGHCCVIRFDAGAFATHSNRPACHVGGILAANRTCSGKGDRLNRQRLCRLVGGISFLTWAVLGPGIAAPSNSAETPTPPKNLRLVGGDAPIGAADFLERCAAPGVLLCEGFDSQGVIDWDGRNGFFWNGIQTAPNQGTLDTTVKSSGAGSLRFNTPDPRVPDGAGTAGQFVKSFGKDFGEGTTFYLQWRMRFSPAMLALSKENTGGGQGFKQIIAHRRGSTCAATELTFTNGSFVGRPTWYTACGGRGVVNQISQYEYEYQQGDYDTCVYAHSLGPLNCWHFTADEWLTFYWKVRIGTWGQPNSHLEAWAARESGPFEKIFDKSDMVLTSSGDYNAVTLTPYMNARASSGTPTHPQAYVWYDELIVSGEPIAAPKFGGQ